MIYCLRRQNIIFVKFSTISNFSHANNKGVAEKRNNNVTLSSCNTVIVITKTAAKFVVGGGGSSQGNKLANT